MQRVDMCGQRSQSRKKIGENATGITYTLVRGTFNLYIKVHSSCVRFRMCVELFLYPPRNTELRAIFILIRIHYLNFYRDIKKKNKQKKLPQPASKQSNYNLPRLCSLQLLFVCIIYHTPRLKLLLLKKKNNTFFRNIKKVFFMSL